MGNVCGPELTTEENEVASGEIERQLKEDEEKFKKISRLLLLGKCVCVCVDMCHDE